MPGTPLDIIIPGAGAKSAYYDRNPNPLGPFGGQSLGQGPTAGTQMQSITVPTGKRFYVPGGTLTVERRTAATTVGRIEIKFMTSGSILFANVVMTGNNAVGDRATSAVASGLVINAGTIVQVWRFDTSTGGTADYFWVIPVVHFDV